MREIHVDVSVLKLTWYLLLRIAVSMVAVKYMLSAPNFFVALLCAALLIGVNVLYVDTYYKDVEETNG